jgi:nicotinamidase-related amidase
MSSTDNLSWCHLCIDMQRLFCEDTPWHVEWMDRTIPKIASIVEIAPERTVFTRFIPPDSAEHASGAWKKYYRKWAGMTRERLPTELLDIVPPLARFMPPARLCDKVVYSPWFDGRLHRHLRSRDIRRVIVTGGETDVCVMATVFGAIDLGYEVTVVSDAVCSGADETHDAGLKLLSSRFSLQVDVMTGDELLAQWH